MRPIQNPPNPFTSYDVRYFEDVPHETKLEIYEDATRNILAKNDSPDIGFRWSLNPYRGCTHACAYCYARPSHEYLGFGAGTDFEMKIVVKKNAPELLRQAFLKKSWKGEFIMLSGDTDCYQPLEASYQLTRRVLEVCLEFGNPIGIVTKSFLIVRDVELLEKLHERTHLSISISIPILDEKIARAVEPGAASVAKRFEAMKILAEAGLDVRLNVAPIIPGLNDSDIPVLLKRAKAAGARRAFPILLRLPGSVKDVFLTRLQKDFPLAYEKIVGRIRQVRDGKLNNTQFGKSFEGTGQYWENIEKMFEVQAAKLGLNRRTPKPDRPSFRRPSAQQEFQLSA